MVFFNYSSMEMTAKVVYYGPGLCGKTTNLRWIFDHTAIDARGEMISLASEVDRTLFIDLLPVDLGSIAGFNTRIQLYTVPGQVFYNTTLKLVLKGVDGIVFVADSQRPMLQSNLESLRKLEENLAERGRSLQDLPVVLQYNKRDLPSVCSVEELDQTLNLHDWPAIEASALNGQGVFETLKMISRATLMSLKGKLIRGRPKIGNTVQHETPTASEASRQPSSRSASSPIAPPPYQEALPAAEISDLPMLEAHEPAAGDDWGFSLEAEELTPPTAATTMPSPPVEPPIAREDPAPGRKRSSDVFVSTVSPELVRPGAWFVVEVIFHIGTYEVVETRGQRIDGEVGAIALREGARLAAELSPLDPSLFEIDQAAAECIWGLPFRRMEFLARAKREIEYGTYRFRVAVYCEGVQLMRSYLVVQIGSDASPPYHKHPKVRRRLPQSTFASYARADARRVYDRVETLMAAGIRAFLDCLDIKPADNWHEVLEREILERDSLLLFWSTAARGSPWVDREWRFALEHKGDRHILPNALEPREICPPPPELAHLQFGSILTQLIKPTTE